MDSLSQEDLMDVSWNLLIAKSSTPEMAVLIRDKIGGISAGSSSHRAGVLKVALKKAFELEKKKRQYPEVRLRCPNDGCTRYSDHVSRSDIGTDVICRLCFNPGDQPLYFLCAYCWFGRTGDYAWCLGCERKFE